MFVFFTLLFPYIVLIFIVALATHTQYIINIIIYMQKCKLSGRSFGTERKNKWMDIISNLSGAHFIRPDTDGKIYIYYI